MFNYFFNLLFFFCLWFLLFYVINWITLESISFGSLVEFKAYIVAIAATPTVNVNPTINLFANLTGLSAKLLRFTTEWFNSSSLFSAFSDFLKRLIVFLGVFLDCLFFTLRLYSSSALSWSSLIFLLLK